MEFNNRIEDPERDAEGRRQQMRVEPRREPVIRSSGPLMQGERMAYAEERIDQNRIVSHLLIMLGVFCLIFAGFWLIFVGWDVRGGHEFTIGLSAISAAVGLVLIVAGAVRRSRQPMLRYDRRRPKREHAA